jgi:hypothetical protein
VAAVTAGCGTVTASPPAAGGNTVVPGTTASASPPPGTANHSPASTGPASTGPASTGPASTGPASGGPASGGGLRTCQGSAPAGQLLFITTASNGKTYCARVGERVEVQLRGSVSSRWLEPLASSNVLTPVPNGALSLIAGLTEEFFVAARTGQVLITSVRPPCQIDIPQWKEGGGIEPAFPVPRTYPLRFCAPAQRLSVSILVIA